RHVRLRAGQVGQRQLHRVADGNSQPRLAFLREAKPSRIGALADRAMPHRLEIGLENLKRVSAEPRLGKTDPTVLPDSAAIVEEGLQLQQSATRRFATCLATRNVPEEARFADSKRKVAIVRAAGNHGLQFIFATGG